MVRNVETFVVREIRFSGGYPGTLSDRAAFTGSNMAKSDRIMNEYITNIAGKTTENRLRRFGNVSIEEITPKK